jgi:hypothetical protein
MDVLGVEADRFQNPQRLRQNLISDAISGHGNDCVFRHDCSLKVSTAETPRAAEKFTYRTNFVILSEAKDQL